jgi:metal-responsive CopG/Arc/MetJ family transcriptional regulator
MEAGVQREGKGVGRVRGITAIISTRGTERAVHELSMNRSVLIRSAVEMYLRARQRDKLERQIAESFAANAEFDRQLVEDFAHVGAEIDS